MSNELFWRCIFIKLKIKTKFKNITENNDNLIETYAIKNKNKISYHHDDTIYKITILDNQIILIRDNQEFTHKFIFDIDNITKSEYYIKEFKNVLEIPIKTTKLIIKENKITIEYIILDNNYNYSYILDMEEIS